MARFTDLVSSVGVGDDGVTMSYPDTFLADLDSAYAEDMSVPAAKIQVLETENLALKNEVTMLKAHNYELLIAAPSGEAHADGEGDNDAEEKETTIDDLFDEKE